MFLQQRQIIIGSVLAVTIRMLDQVSSTMRSPGCTACVPNIMTPLMAASYRGIPTRQITLSRIMIHRGSLRFLIAVSPQAAPNTAPPPEICRREVAR